jgi:abortive infection bacteriophage resistance protein
MIEYYYRKYDEEHVPSWMLMEVVPFGCVIKLFKNLKRHHQKAVAKHYGFNEVIIISWVILLLDIRNICAHHERLWNRNLKRIKIPRGNSCFSHHGRLFNGFLVISHLLNVISPGPTLIEDLIKLLRKSHIDLTQMGFSENWENCLLVKKNKQVR